MSTAAAIRPMTVDRIDDITKLLDDDLGRDIYRVALANDAGESMSVCLPDNELRVFQNFYAALRNRGVRFADRGRYTAAAGRIGGSPTCLICSAGSYRYEAPRRSKT